MTIPPDPARTKSVRLRNMPPSELARGFGVSLPTFLKWMKTIVDKDTDQKYLFYKRIVTYPWSWSFTSVVSYRCVSRVLLPKEVSYICTVLGDPDCKLDHKRVTLSDLAKEAGISLKTAMRLVDAKKEFYLPEIFGGENYTRALPPVNVRIFRKMLGIEPGSDQ